MDVLLGEETDEGMKSEPRMHLGLLPTQPVALRSSNSLDFGGCGGGAS